MADNILLSNDALGYEGYDQIIPLVGANAPQIETSAHGLSASGIIGLFQAPRAGRIVDYGYGVVQQVLSASGFLSGTVDAGVFINGTAAVSNSGAINMFSGSAAATRVNVNASTTSTAFFNPPTINLASAAFNAGDQIGFQFNARSVGSGAAGRAGTGFYGFVRVRFSAQ